MNKFRRLKIYLKFAWKHFIEALDFLLRQEVQAPLKTPWRVSGNQPWAELEEPRVWMELHPFLSKVLFAECENKLATGCMTWMLKPKDYQHVLAHVIIRITYVEEGIRKSSYVAVCSLCSVSVKL